MRTDVRFHPRALLAALRGRWRALTARANLDRDLDEEMRFHVEMETEQQMAAGLPRAEARRRALVAFGGLAQTAESHREARGTRFVDDAVADLRYATRALARAPGFFATCAFTLATAIAVCTMLVTAVNGFFFRPLPVPDGESLVALFTSDYSSADRRGASSYADIVDIAGSVAAVADVVGEGRVMLGVGSGERIVMAQGVVITPGYFPVLGVRPYLGRFPEGVNADVPTVAISYSLWRRAFNADSSVIGRPVQLNGQPFLVVAVSAPEFRGTSREIASDFWMDGAFAPLVLPRDDFTRERTARRFHAYARLHDDVSLDAFNARLGAVAGGLLEQYPDAWRDQAGQGRRLTAIRERDAHLADIPRASLVLVVGGVMAIGLGLLAVASANLASLQLARGASRRREVATRLALGASRGRIVRQLLAECVLVIVPGAVGGVGAALAATGLISHYRPIPLPSIDLALDWRTLAFIGGALALILVVFGLLPALQSIRGDLITDLRGGSRPGAGGVRVGRARGGLIVAQVAVSVLLTALSSLIAFALLRDAQAGRADARSILVATVNVLPDGGDSTAVRALLRDLTQRLAGIPGVEGASASQYIPIRGTRGSVYATVRGALGEAIRRELDANSVGPDYFRVVGLPMWRGRAFDARDGNGGPPAVIVSRAMADALWPNENAVGKRIEVESRGRARDAEVVGVVADPVGQGPLTAASFPGMLYLPLRPSAEAEFVLHVRASTGQAAVASQVTQLLRTESRRLVATEVLTLDRYYYKVVFPQRLMAYAAGALAALQLLLAIGGLAGLVAYVTALRRRDVGILTALGAGTGDVLTLVLRQSVGLAAAGAAVGLALSLAVSRVVAATLPVTTSVMLGALLVAVAIFGVTATVAMLVPAVRALRVTPAEALRAE